MARILVTGPTGIAARILIDAVLGRLRADDHDAEALPDEGAPEALADADALVAVLDDALPPQAAAMVGLATALGKPVLGLHDGAPRALLEACTRTARAADLDGLLAALPAFYEDVRPFAGRLVRDHVPRLVEEAGHQVKFRELGPEERPRFLKQKVLEEAKALLKADRGTEPDEIADLLEALETLIRTRGFEREDLRRVKDGKLRRRGGFEKGYVVEATGDRAQAADAPSEGHAEVETAAKDAEPAATPTEAPAADSVHAGSTATDHEPPTDGGPDDPDAPTEQAERPPAFEI